MAVNVATKNLLEEFNSFFEGSAKVVINGTRLEITINNATLIISLPEVVGSNATGQSRRRDV